MPSSYPNYNPSGQPDGQSTGVASIIGPGVTELGGDIYLANDDGTFGDQITGGGGGGGLDQSGAGSPVGTVTPTSVGYRYTNTTDGTLYIATGATNNDWLLVGGATDLSSLTTDVTAGISGIVHYPESTALDIISGDILITDPANFVNYIDGPTTSAMYITITPAEIQINDLLVGAAYSGTGIEATGGFTIGDTSSAGITITEGDVGTGGILIEVQSQTIGGISITDEGGGGIALNESGGGSININVAGSVSASINIDNTATGGISISDSGGGGITLIESGPSSYIGLSVPTDGGIELGGSGGGSLSIGTVADKIGFFGGTEVIQQAVTGSLSTVVDPAAQAVLTSIIAALAAATGYSLVTDSTT